MTTTYRPGDRVRHSRAFMRAFSHDHGEGPGDSDFEKIAHCFGTVLSPTGDPETYLVSWDWFDDLDPADLANGEIFEWHISDFVSA